MALLTSPEEGEFNWHEVSTLVNRVANDDAQLILPTPEEMASFLADEAPAYVLRYARDPGALRFVIPAARSFAGTAG